MRTLADSFFYFQEPELGGTCMIAILVFPTCTFIQSLSLCCVILKSAIVPGDSGKEVKKKHIATSFSPLCTISRLSSIPFSNDKLIISLFHFCHFLFFQCIIVQHLLPRVCSNCLVKNRLCSLMCVCFYH